MNLGFLPRRKSYSRPARTLAAARTLAVAFALAMIAAPAAQAQNLTVLYSFTGGADGEWPVAGLAFDAAGNLYGTAAFTYGLDDGPGTVFELRHSGGTGWVFTTLYSFTGGSDGAGPASRVTIAPDGTLLSTTTSGGLHICSDEYCGTFFRLRPSPTAPKTVLAPWNETVLYSFTGGSAGANPQGDLTFDQAGNIYGTTLSGGSGNPGNGIVYELTPSASGWYETNLYSATYYQIPVDGVVFDKPGNLYGVFEQGGPYGCGGVYQLSPSGSGWREQILHTFTCGNDGGTPLGGVILDTSGNLYGTTSTGGSGGGGTVFELTPTSGGWIFQTIYSFAGVGLNFPGPQAKLVMDAAGNLYGTTSWDGAYKSGSVFKLSPANGGWTYASLHDFTGGSDGAEPQSALIFDATGNLYGTTRKGGSFGWGTVFEITP